MKRNIVPACLGLALLLLCGCESAPPDAATAPPPAQAASTPRTPAATATAVAANRPAPTLPAAPTPLFRTPTPRANPGTVIKDDGSFLVLSHPFFFWTLKLPRDWLVTYDRGFELFANNPQQTVFVRLFSQVWPTKEEWLPNARAYVDYWKKYPGGSQFPIYAAGTQLAETGISPDTYGGPYLRYEFDDAKRGLRYQQTYASGGGPNSVVFTVWTKTADREATQAALDGILSSLALLKLP